MTQDQAKATKKIEDLLGANLYTMLDICRMVEITPPTLYKRLSTSLWKQRELDKIELIRGL